MQSRRGAPQSDTDTDIQDDVPSNDSSPILPRTTITHPSPQPSRISQQRLSVSTNHIALQTHPRFTMGSANSATPISSGVASTVSANSPDPHDFYRLQPVAFTPSPLSRKPVAGGMKKTTNGASPMSQISQVRTLSQSRTQSPDVGRIHNPKLRSSLNTRSRETSSGPSTRNPTDTFTQSSPALLSSPGLRKASVKDLLNRFENQEEPISSTASPASATSASSRRPTARTLPRPTPSSKDGAEPAGPSSRGGTPTKMRKMSTGVATDAAEQWRILSAGPAYGPRESAAASSPPTFRSPAVARSSPQPRRGLQPARPQLDRSRSASTVDQFSPQSQTSLSILQISPPSNSQRPLFGEIITAIPTRQSPSHHHLAPIDTRLRRGSEGVLPSPRSSGGHNRTRSNLDVSPSSPTAWYMGLTTSLEGINPDRGPSSPTQFIRSPFSIDLPAPLRLNTSRSLSRSRLSGATRTSLPPLNTQSSGRRSHLPRPDGRQRAESNSSDLTGSQSSTQPHTRPSSRLSIGDGEMRPSSIPRPAGAMSPVASPTSSRMAWYDRSKHGPAVLPPLRASPGQSLQAIITELPPKLSPPLRSSRPRPHVTMASTAASRGRVSERLQQIESDKTRKEKRKSRREKIPELGNIDFAAKQRQIMQALRNGDSTQRSLSQSTMGLRTRSGTLDSRPDEPEGERAIKSDNDVSRMDQSVGSLEFPESDGLESSSLMEAARDDHRSLDPVIMITEPDLADDEADTPPRREESPIPQMPGAFDTPIPEDLTPVVSEKPPNIFTSFDPPVQTLSPPAATPQSAAMPASPYDIGILDVDDESSDEEDEELEDEVEEEEEGVDEDDESDQNNVKPVQDKGVEPSNPWTSSLPGLSKEEVRSTRLARSRTVLSQILQMRTPDTPQTNFVSFEEEDRSADDLTEHGSIQIMLGASPTQERFSHRSDGFMWNEEDGEFGSPTGDNEAGNQQRTPVDRSKPLPRLPISRTQSRMRTGYRSKATSVHSTASSDQLSRTSSYHPLDEEAYRRISQVLQEYYRNSRHITPELIHEVQHLITTHTPDLARQGRWDPTIVTQLYMEELAKGSYGAPAPDLPPMPPLDTYYAHKVGVANQQTLGQSSLGGGESGQLRRPNVTLGPSEWATPRPNLVGPADWLEASPSMYWEGTKGPTETSSESTTPAEETEPAIPSADSAVSLGVDAAKPAARASPAMSHSTGSSSDRHSKSELTPVLPKIDTGGDGLGLDLGKSPPPLDGTHEKAVPATADREESRASSPGNAVLTHGPPSINPRESSRLYTMYRTSSAKSIPHLNQLRDGRPRSDASSSIQRLSTATTAEPSGTDGESLDQPTELVSLDPIDSATKARLDDRRKTLMELVNTEKSYLRDMTVIEQIYRATGKDIPRLTQEDLKVIFGNLDDMIAFSKRFLDALKQAIASVYTMPKSVIGFSRNSVAGLVNGHSAGDRLSVLHSEGSEIERDERTTIGSTFGQHLQALEKVYGEYSSNLGAAQQRVMKVQQDESIANWLRECAEAANSLTNAWNLDALLVKPVQRLLKYYPLLERILKYTTEDHPDYSALKVAAAQMLESNDRINALQQKAVVVPVKPSGSSRRRERGQSDVRHGVGKLLGRGADRFRQPQIFTVKVEDQTYKNLSNKFGEHLFQLQLVLRDIDQYLLDVQIYFDRFFELARAIEGYLDVGATPNPSIESKWRKFGIVLRELGNNALSEHVSCAGWEIL